MEASAIPHTVLTYLGTRPVDGLIDNHRRYAERHGYRYAVVDGTHVWGPRQPTLFRYHAVHHHLIACPEGAWLLVLDQFAVVYRGLALEAVFGDADSLVVAQANNDALATTSMLLLRNVAAVRERLRQLILRIAHWAMRVGPDIDAPEVALVSEFFAPQPCTHVLPSGVTPNIQANWPGFHYHDQLHRVQPFAANDAPAWEHRDGQWLCDPAYDFRGVLNLLEDARALEEGRPPPHVLLAEAKPADGDELHLNPEAEIAFVSLYTPNVASYGLIHERNFARYCRRHGYGYHLYRTVPSFVPPGVPGSWAKPHVMRRHLGQHAFLFWVDADVLAVLQATRMEPVIGDREALVGTDHTAWPMKSGMVGLRNTPAMHGLVEEVCRRIEAAEDRSSVHANGGDQTYFTWAFEARGLVTQACVVDSLSLDASPIYATRRSHLVHFPTQFNPFRAASMALWDRWSLENDAQAAP